MRLLISLMEAILVLTGAGSLEELDESELERFEALASHPVCINVASAGRLRSCGLFSEYQAASALFEKDIFDLITPAKCVEIRKTIGGPAPSEVQKQIEKLTAFVKENTSSEQDPIGDFI